MEIHRSYKSEIPPKIIFEEMKDCFYDFYKKNRKINSNILIKDYFQIRNSLINMLKKVSDKLGFKSQTYFLSIYYMDIIITENNEIIIFHNYTSLALACLVIASKYCENDPNVPELPYFIRIYNSIVENKHAIAISDLIYNEVKICKILKYHLHYYTIYDYNSFLFGHGILKLDQIKDIKRDKDLPFSIFAKKILEKIYKKSRSYLDYIITKKVCFKYSSLLLSIYIMQKSVESIIISESKINSDIEKMKIRKKAHKYFKDIMNNFYKLNYESMEEYMLLKKEIESYKKRNENSIQNIFESLKPNKNIGKIMNNINFDSNTHKYLNTYSNKLSNTNNINDYFSELNCKNSVNLELIQNKFLSGKNQLIAQTTKNNIHNGKMLMKKTQNKDFNSSLNKIKYSNKANIYASTNLEIENKRQNIDKNIIVREKRIHSNNKYSLNNSKIKLNNDKNIIQYNNYSNKLAYSINLENNRFNDLNRSKDLTRPKSNSPKNIDNSSQEKLSINKKSTSKKFMNSNIINKTEINETKNKESLNGFMNLSPKVNLINEIDKTNEKQLMNNINKLYFKKILYNGGSKILPKSKNKNINRKNTNSKKLNDIINRTNYNLKINMNKQFGIIDISEIKTHEDKDIKINCNLNNRYGNIFLLSGNNSDNDEKEEGNNKTRNNIRNNCGIENNSSIGENYIENKDKIKDRKEFSIKNRNIKENRNNFLNTSSHESKLLKISRINGIGNIYFESVEKNKNNPKNKNYNLYCDNNNIKFKSKRDYYINTDINESQCSTSIKTKILRAKSKELESKRTSNPKYKKISIQTKQSDNKINILNSKQNNFEIKSSNQEYNIIKFAGNI